MSRDALGWVGAFAYAALFALAPAVDWRVLPGVGVVAALRLFVYPWPVSRRRSLTVGEAALFGLGCLWFAAVVLLKPFVPELTSVVAKFMTRSVTLAVGALPVAVGLGLGLGRLVRAILHRREGSAT